jgi:IS1 family transposase
VEQPVARNVFISKGIFVGYMPIYVDSPGAVPELGNFFLRQRFCNAEPFCIDYSGSNSGKGFYETVVGAGKVRFERIFPKEDIPPMYDLECWRLTRVLNLHTSHWSPVGMRNSSFRWRIRPGCFQWRGDINDVSEFRQNISPQLPLRTLSAEDRLYNQNAYSHPCPNNAPDRRLHVMPRERIERFCVSFFLFGLCMWLFYGAAVKTLSAGRYLWTSGIWIAGFVCFLLAIECSDAATFGHSGWVSVWRGFLCAYFEKDCDSECYDKQFHSTQSVSQKGLTRFLLCNTFSDMANVLSAEKQTAIIAALAEGSSIRSIERITGVHRDTIMRLGVRVGKGCEMLMDSKMQDLNCNYLQLDEVWGFIGKKERHCRPDDDPQYGDVWTFCAIDSETKLVPSFKCGKRNHETANAFVQDIANRVRNRVQISTDALGAYGEAVERAFGADVDYGQIVKVYVHDGAHHPERQYSAPSFTSAYRRPIAGNPEMEFVSTSHVERLNATTRLHVKRLSRLTLAFSKKFENFQSAVALHFAYYNFVRRHATLRCTPAMAAGIERDFWTVSDLVEAVA